jgi:hypothetical protein
VQSEDLHVTSNVVIRFIIFRRPLSHKRIAKVCREE